MSGSAHFVFFYLFLIYINTTTDDYQIHLLNTMMTTHFMNIATTGVIELPKYKDTLAARGANELFYFLQSCIALQIVRVTIL